MAMARTPMGGSPRERGGHAYTTVREHLEPPHLHMPLPLPLSKTTTVTMDVEKRK